MFVKTANGYINLNTIERIDIRKCKQSEKWEIVLIPQITEDVTYTYKLQFDTSEDAEKALDRIMQNYTEVFMYRKMI